MSRYDEFEQIRLAKLDALRARGIDPYPVRFDRSHTAAAVLAEHDHIQAGEETRAHVSVAGRLMLKRGHGKLSFGVVRDASADIQIMCALDRLGEDGLSQFEDLDLGDWVGVRGE